MVCVWTMGAGAQTIRTAGELFVHLDAAQVTGVAEGAPVPVWPNLGSLDDFVPAVAGQGATYAADIGGAAALQFNGAPGCAMAQAGHTGNATKGGVPLSILGTNAWSAEVWVFNPVGSGIETLLTWTSRRDGGDRRMMEMRYGSDLNNAVEHWMRNMGWNIGLPAYGQWHHVACTRDEACVNRLYLDGRLVNTLDMGGVNMLNLATNNALFAVGAVDTGNGWDYPLSGAIAVVRVHDGTLSAEDVKHNFTVEGGRFGGLWQAAGTAAWNEPANWAAGAPPAFGQPVYLNGGGTAVYDGAPYADGVYTGMWHAVHGGMTLAGGHFTALPTFANAYVRAGIGAGSAFALTLAGGTFDVGANTLRLGETAGASATLTLGAGGRLVAQRVLRGDGSAALVADGGTLQAVGNATDHMQGLSSASVQDGGLAFHVPENVAVSVSQPLLEDAGSPGGGLVKEGPGTLTLGGANTVAGPLAVNGGALKLEANALPAGYAAPITLANEAAIGWNKTGGATALAALFTPQTAGSLMLFAANAADTIDLSALPGVSLCTDSIFTYTGTLTPYTNLYRFAPRSGTLSYEQPIIDLPGATGRVEVSGAAGTFVRLAGDSAYTGGTLLESGGIVMAHANALGARTPGTSDIVCRSGTVLRVQCSLAEPDFFGRVAADPEVSLQLSGAGLTNTLDFSATPNLFTGTENTSVKSYFTGTLTPYGDTYLLGNTGIDVGDGGYGFTITNLTDGAGGAPRRVLISGVGVVDTRNNAAHSGGTRVERGGKIVVTGDRGFGTVPALFDPSNIVFDSGVFRTENRYVTLAPTRGIAFNGTCRIHASGSLPAQLMIPGDITGSATLRMTDMGWVTFAGTNNTYQGRVQLEGSWGAMMIGDGTNFSWASTGGIVGTGTRGWLYLNNGAEDTFEDTFSGKGILTKKGLGTITLATANTHANLPTNTVVEAGTLRYGVADALPHGAGYGVVDLGGNAALDINGWAGTFNGLTGGGCVTNSAGTALEVQVGSDTLDSSFSGRLAPPLTLTKIGTRRFTLNHICPTPEPVTVAAGTLALNVGTALTNGVTIAQGATVQALGYQGLRGEYYDNAFTGGSGGNWPALGTTPEAVDAVLAGRSPMLIAGSGSFGETFDSGTKGERFPGKYSGSIDKFAVRWTGQFLAEQAGSHTFRVFADDGCLVFLDGQIVANNRTGSGWTTDTVSLTQGWHDIIVFFYENGGDQVVRLFMTPPGGSEAALPQRLLRAHPTTVVGVDGAAGGSLGAEAFALFIVDQAEDSFVGAFSGAAATNAVIEKQGAGVITLQQTSGFSGTTRIVQGGITLTPGVSHTGAFEVAAGTLTAGGGTASAPVRIGSLDVAAAGSVTLSERIHLNIDQTADGAFAGTLAGGTADSVIAKSGDAALTVVADLSAYPGDWAVYGGELVIDGVSGGRIAADAAVETCAGGTLVFRSPTDLVFSGAISGDGAVRNEGPGTLTLTGAVSCGVQVAAGQTVILDGAAVEGTVTIEGASHNAGTLIVNTPGTFRLREPISGGGSVRVGADTCLLIDGGGITDGQSLLLEGGTLLLNNGGALGFDDTMWVTTGVARFVSDGQDGTILELTPNISNKRSAAYYREQVVATEPWVIDLTFHKGISGGCPGDGFGVFFQNDLRGTDALPTSGWYGSVTPYTPSFGFQYYLMTSDCYLAWVENGTLVGKVQHGLFSQSGGEFKARMTFDGTKMIVDMQQGANVYSMTNLNAGARLAALGTPAWLGIVGGTGGCYGQQIVDAFTFSYTDEATRSFTNALELAAGTASAIEAVPSVAEGLPLAVGTVTVNAGSSLDLQPAADTDPDCVFLHLGDLIVRGDGTLTVAPEGTAAIAGDTWTFTPGAVLTLSGVLTLPTNVTIVIDGPIPDGRMNLVDLRGATVLNLEEVTFTLVGGDSTDRVSLRDGWLYTIGSQGTLLWFQ
ncbi:MAG: autotransporter-associated beta strand repeat-containing protein [Kiritimatiellae bacterium]|nr:autotransporter-associated beta strand repeat-containing protein [Kiritimatiellia bacterium]